MLQRQGRSKGALDEDLEREGRRFRTYASSNRFYRSRVGVSSKQREAEDLRHQGPFNVDRAPTG